MRLASLVICCCLLLFSSASAATVISHKTGATAQVSARFAARFQGYVNAIERAGGRVRFMGGYRHGRCSSGHQHPCGKALDVCQMSRDRVDPSCRLPPRYRLAQIARAHGLFEGGQWCHGDYGHAQAGASDACRSRHRYARYINSSPYPG